MFSILASNPGLRLLSLTGPAIPKSDSDVSAPKVILRHVEILYLKGDFHRVFGILDQLVFSRPLESIEIPAVDTTTEKFSHFLRPHFQRYFQCDYGVRDTLRVKARS